MRAGPWVFLNRLGLPIIEERTDRAESRKNCGLTAADAECMGRDEAEPCEQWVDRS
jgi:hypothetical protein